MAYELVQVASFPCPCGAGQVVWERTEHDWHPGEGSGSPRLDCGSCGDVVLWSEPLGRGYFYVSAAEADELSRLERRRWELLHAATKMCEERHGARWMEMLREASTKRGGMRALLRQARALPPGSDSTIARHLRERVESITRDSIGRSPRGVLEVLGVDDADVRRLLDESTAADGAFGQRREALCTRPVPAP